MTCRVEQPHYKCTAHHWLMPISCHFRGCKALLDTSLTHVSSAVASVQTFTFTVCQFCTKHVLNFSGIKIYTELWAVNRNLFYRRQSHSNVAGQSLTLVARRYHERSKDTGPVTQDEVGWTFRDVKSYREVRIGHDNDSGNPEHCEAWNSHRDRWCSWKVTRLW